MCFISGLADSGISSSKVSDRWVSGIAGYIAGSNSGAQKFAPLRLF